MARQQGWFALILALAIAALPYAVGTAFAQPTQPGRAPVTDAEIRYQAGGSPLAPEPKASRFAGIEAGVERYFPGMASRIAMRWSGPLAITFDRVCSMGVGGAHGNVYHALGYSGHGLALGALAGQILRRGGHDQAKARHCSHSVWKLPARSTRS